jgi:hypothetical protein
LVGAGASVQASGDLPFAPPRILSSVQSPAVSLSNPDQQRFNMLAGTQGVYGEIGARAVVLEPAWPAQGYAVVFAAGGLDAIVATEETAPWFQ